MTSESGTFTKYTEALKSFSNASGTFQSIIFSAGRNKELDIPDNIQYIIKPAYLVDPTTFTSGASFLSSTEQMKTAAPQVINIINNIEEKNLAKGDLQKLQEVKVQMIEAKRKAEESQQEELGAAVKDSKSADDLMAYYHSIVDIEFSTKNLHSLAIEVSSKVDERYYEPSLASKIFNKFKGLWDRIKSKLDQIVDRIKGITGGLRDSIVDMFSNFAKMAQKGVEGIIDAFVSLSDYFIEFVLTLIEQMFKLLSKIRSLVTSEGYAISNIEIKIPSLKFEYVNMFQVSIPLPNIEPPEIRISLSISSASKGPKPN